MRINHNIMSMNTHRKYNINANKVSKSVEKLSSGLKLNRAADDAAGVAISEKMRAQIRGLQTGSKNTQDAISLTQTAEGALQASHDVLHRMREIAVQAASDTNEDALDRAALDAEFQTLKIEVDEIATKTNFNNMYLINGDYAAPRGELSSATGFATDNTYVYPDAQKGQYKFEVKANPAQITVTGNPKPKNGEDIKLNVGDTSVSFNGITIYFDRALTEQDLAAPLTAPSVFAGKNPALVDVTESAGKSALVIQTGANKGDEVSFNIKQLDVKGINIDKTNVAQQKNASRAIALITAAINEVSSQRGELGALSNSFEFSIQNVDISAENVQASESRIRDVDMAKEMSVFTKENILSQASTAMLSQANAVPQSILQLIGGG